MEFSALEFWAVTGAFTALGAWNVWQEMKRVDIDRRVTVIESKDTPDYRELMSIITPIKEKVDAIAIKLDVEPDRRHNPSR